MKLQNWSKTVITRGNQVCWDIFECLLTLWLPTSPQEALLFPIRNKNDIQDVLGSSRDTVFMLMLSVEDVWKQLSSWESVGDF